MEDTTNVEGLYTKSSIILLRLPPICLTLRLDVVQLAHVFFFFIWFPAVSINSVHAVNGSSPKANTTHDFDIYCSAAFLSLVQKGRSVKIPENSKPKIRAKLVVLISTVPSGDPVGRLPRRQNSVGRLFQIQKVDFLGLFF